ncbi:hypothetical protein BZA05DRAFT_384681 [Tricharina praecox]|uniref:uncharacterized protein n=1 Tax=Tricharina praecox TaxID=43433 RepID=UPI00221EAD0A|nr:uncharacterized protein BZA05DRAFT_384681 [Tricharina praecox]KAI5857744.1 hypothetical protein BZA05DRAFT_384681 [Tricharina praecox]
MRRLTNLFFLNLFFSFIFFISGSCSLDREAAVQLLLLDVFLFFFLPLFLALLSCSRSSSLLGVFCFFCFHVISCSSRSFFLLFLSFCFLFDILISLLFFVSAWFRFCLIVVGGDTGGLDGNGIELTERTYSTPRFTEECEVRGLWGVTVG